jgi:hypothetical protein
MSNRPRSQFFTRKVEEEEAKRRAVSSESSSMRTRTASGRRDRQRCTVYAGDVVDGIFGANDVNDDSGMQERKAALLAAIAKRAEERKREALQQRPAADPAGSKRLAPEDSAMLEGAWGKQVNLESGALTETAGMIKHGDETLELPCRHTMVSTLQSKLAARLFQVGRDLMFNELVVSGTEG